MKHSSVIFKRSPLPMNVSHTQAGYLSPSFTVNGRHGRWTANPGHANNLHPLTAATRNVDRTDHGTFRLTSNDAFLVAQRRC